TPDPIGLHFSLAIPDARTFPSSVFLAPRFRRAFLQQPQFPTTARCEIERIRHPGDEAAAVIQRLQDADTIVVAVAKPGVVLVDRRRIRRVEAPQISADFRLRIRSLPDRCVVGADEQVAIEFRQRPRLLVAVIAESGRTIQRRPASGLHAEGLGRGAAHRQLRLPVQQLDFPVLRIFEVATAPERRAAIYAVFQCMEFRTVCRLAEAERLRAFLFDLYGRAALVVEGAPVQPAIVLLDRAARIAVARNDRIRIVLQWTPYLRP